MIRIRRRKTRTVAIGPIKIGLNHSIAVQSMVKVAAKNVAAAVAEIKELQEAGCEIVRLAVEDREDASAIKKIKAQVSLPLVADIHFDYRLALAAVENGADKIRLNPGNIYKPQEVLSVIAAARNAHIPIRIGANSGSLRLKAKSTAQALVASVRQYLKIFEKSKFFDIVISLKGSDILETIEAYREMARICDYPMHLGVTATGLALEGAVKSSIGMGVLLFDGIGDTIRVSLLDESRREVQVARILLNSLGLRRFGPELICCPTCGRCEVDLEKKARRLDSFLNQWGQKQQAKINHIKIALMGCVVNGPGEAREADIGIAFSKHKGVLFKKGKIIRTVDLKNGEAVLMKMLQMESQLTKPRRT